MSEQNFTYISNDSWIQLFYQIIKVFYFSRINKSMVSSIPNFSPEKINININQMDASNLVNSQEGILIKWLEYNYEAVFDQPKPIVNFEQDLKNCNILS